MVVSRYRRKGLLAEHNVTMSDIATSVGCSRSMVSRVVSDERGVAESDLVVRVRAVIAKRVGVPLTHLWPRASKTQAA